MGTTSEAARGNTNRCRARHQKESIARAHELWDAACLLSEELAWLSGLMKAAVCAIAHRNGLAPGDRWTSPQASEQRGADRGRRVERDATAGFRIALAKGVCMPPRGDRVIAPM